MKYSTPWIWILILGLSAACKKTSPAGPTPVTPGSADCSLTGETSSEAGYNGSYTYVYDKDGNPDSIYHSIGTGYVDVTYDINYKGLISSYLVYNKPGGEILENDGDLFNNILPSQEDISINDGDTLRVDYWTYFFYYDNKSQLIKVSEHTYNVKGDYEYDLSIYYNDQGNVTGMQYVWTTGPNIVIPPITVDAYDDKPNPYSGVKGWLFLLPSLDWSRSDPERILVALSKNNPLDFKFGVGDDQFKRTMSYTYNEKGFPTVRNCTNSNVNGTYSFQETYSYACK